DNTLTGAETLSNVEVELGLPPELQLAAGEQAVKSISRLEANRTETVGWRVSARPQSEYKAVRYGAKVRASGIEETAAANYIILPPTSGALPDVQVLELSPNMKYIGDGSHEFVVTGKGFAELQDNPNMELSLVREHDGHRYTLPASYYTISGNQMLLKLEIGRASCRERV